MDIEIASRQRHGQALYRDKNYRGALAVFDAIAAGLVDPPLSLLDNRAATFAKLDDLPRALRDSKRMITLAKKDAAGYLRTGQILQRMGEQKKASDIYNYGLKNVEVGSEGAKLLGGMRKKLAARLAPPTATDPLLVLPLELILTILQHLDFRNIQCLLGVSHKWKELLTSMPELYKHVDLSLAQRQVPVPSLKKYLLRGKRMTSHITLDRVGAEPSDFYKSVVGMCPKLESLHLKSGLANSSLLSALAMAPALVDLRLGSRREISLAAVTEILHKCSNLTVAEFHHVQGTSRHPAQWRGDLTRLRTLVLNNMIQDPHAVNLNQLLDMVPQLQELTVNNLGYLTVLDLPNFGKLQALRKISMTGGGINTVNMSDLFKLPASLQIGHFPKFVTKTDMSDEKRALFDERFQNLTDLHFTSVERGEECGLSLILLANKGKLERLQMGACLGLSWNEPETGNARKGINDLWCTGLLPRLSYLQVMSPLLRDGCLESLATNCPLLETADLAGNTFITGVGIKALLVKKIKVKRLDLSSCTAIGSDAMEWARQQGVHVVTKSLEGKKGRKIRYG